MSFAEIAGLSHIAARYRVLFVDAYGVLHDGAEAFSGAPEALIAARRAGLRVVIVTNSAGRVDAVRTKLATASIGSECYDAVISSGELAWRHFADQPADAASRLFVISEPSGPAWATELRQPIAASIDTADAILAIGMPFLTEASFHDAGYIDVLRAAAARRLPMVVADSDVTYPSRGVIRLGPGWLARRYAALGGPLIEFGKPTRPIYAAASALLDNPRAAEILAIGDNLLTDIRGAMDFGIDSLLVLEGGVHGAQPPHELRASAAAPTYLARRLAW